MEIRKRKEIQELLVNIHDHFKRLEDYTSIPTLELNVILSKISKLQEKTSVLKHLMSRKEDEGYEEKQNGNIQSPAAEEPEQKNTSRQPTDPEIIDEVGEEQDEVIEQGQEEEKKTSTDDKLPTKEFVDPAETSSGKGIGKLEDYLDLNAKFTNEDHSLSDQLKKQPITNLLTAIGLNERYLFANQLFNGDMAQFIDEIKKLNSFDSEEEALDYFDNKLSNKESWQSSEDLVEAFRLLVERRFQG